MNFLFSIIQLQYMPYILIAVVLAAIIYVAHKANDCNFNIFDLVIDPATNKASITRLWQNVGAATASVVIVQAEINHTLTDTMLAVYLAALGISEGWSKFIGAKYLNKSDSSTQQ